MDNVSNISSLSINGMSAVLYDMESAGTTSVAIAMGDGYVLEMTIFPATGDDNLARALVIFSSIQSYFDDGSQD